MDEASDGCVGINSCTDPLITSQAPHSDYTGNNVSLDWCLALMLNYDSMSQLRKLRKDRGFTLKSLAKAADVHYVSLARLETGKFDPRLSTLRKLASVVS